MSRIARGDIYLYSSIKPCSTYSEPRFTSHRLTTKLSAHALTLRKSRDYSRDLRNHDHSIRERWSITYYARAQAVDIAVRLEPCADPPGLSAPFRDIT